MADVENGGSRRELRVNLNLGERTLTSDTTEGGGYGSRRKIIFGGSPRDGNSSPDTLRNDEVLIDSPAHVVNAAESTPETRSEIIARRTKKFLDMTIGVLGFAGLVGSIVASPRVYTHDTGDSAADNSSWNRKSPLAGMVISYVAVGASLAYLHVRTAKLNRYLEKEETEKKLNQVFPMPINNA